MTHSKSKSMRPKAPIREVRRRFVFASGASRVLDQPVDDRDLDECVLEVSLAFFVDIVRAPSSLADCWLSVEHVVGDG